MKLSADRVLGFSEEHDSGVALVRGNSVVWAANEERYSRIKFHRGVPRMSLEEALSWCRNKGYELPSRVAVASIFHVSEGLGDWTHLAPRYELAERIFSFTRMDRFLWGSSLGPSLLKVLAPVQGIERRTRIRSLLSSCGLVPREVTFVDHHTAHAAGAYYTSGFDNCMIITQDASGDGYCSKVFTGRNGQIQEVHAVPFFHSPGHYYEYVTLLFGFKIGREGKVTGLAARGNPDKTYPIFLSQMSYDPASSLYINHGLYRKAEMRRLAGLLKGFSREDIAAGVQKHLEMMMTQYVADMIRTHWENTPVRLVVTGGVFANVKLNQRIVALPSVASLFVYPHMGDGGLAAGAALYTEGQREKIHPKKITHVYLGDKPTDDVLSTISPFGNRLSWNKPANLPERVAAYLAQGKVVAIVRGNMEYGPRALGHRTLLSQATDPTVNDWLNKRLKRSEFMPFAPIIRAEDADRYFENWKKALPSLPFMTVTVNCNRRCKKEAPAVVHVDGSARPQFVYKDTEPFIYGVLSEYRKLTGLRVLINTSFNIHEQPIVRTALEAIQTFLEGHIDVLVVEDFVIVPKRSTSHRTK